MSRARIIAASIALLTTHAHAQRAIDASSRANAVPLDDGALWTHFAGSAKRNHAPAAPRGLSLDAPAWNAPDRTPIPQTGLVVDNRRVYAITHDPNNPDLAHAVAFDRQTGDELWATPIEAPIFESWSSPAIDLQHENLIVATGRTVAAYDAATGDERWATDLGAMIVNASPVVTQDLGQRDRLLITNYAFGGGEPGALYCINTDPFDEAHNPHQPGELVWTKQLGADTSGNTPAYQGGRVYLGTASNGSGSRGTIRAYDITSDETPSEPIWLFTNTINAGFFAGVTIARGHIYASSYSFTGLQLSANTVKLNKNTGELVWSVPTNRTDASPIVLPDGRVVISGGVATGESDFLPFFGTIPSVGLIDDQGDSATLLWDSALATHNDLNANNVWDFGEPFLSIGGWTHQPIAVQVDARPHLLVGTLPLNTPVSYIGHNTDLRLIDLSLHPTDPGFIVQHATGAGSTPALSRGWVFTSGASGVSAYAPPSSSMLLRDLIDRYTRGELSLDQLKERLPR